MVEEREGRFPLWQKDGDCQFCSVWRSDRHRHVMGELVLTSGKRVEVLV